MKTYLLLAPAVRLMKIGQSQKPMARINELRTMNAADVELLTLLSEKEGDLHLKFKGLRHHGEWFRIDRSVVEYLRALEEHQAADRLEMVLQDG